MLAGTWLCQVKLYVIQGIRSRTSNRDWFLLDHKWRCIRFGVVILLVEGKSYG